jgi:ABC-type dipeptide/oligopeptide/nickel transport system permease component
VSTTAPTTPHGLAPDADRRRRLQRRFWLRRFSELIVMLAGLATLLFFLLRLAGDPAYVIAGQDATPEQVAAIRAEYGLDRPLLLQYVAYLGSLLRLDFGDSLVTGESALGAVLTALPATLLLACLAMAFTLAVAIPLGAWIGFAPDRPLRRWTARAVFFLQGVPAFVMGLVLVQVFAVQLAWLPSVGYGRPANWILPVVSLAFFLVPKLTRVVAANVSEAMREDYVRVARATGAAPREILYGYALPNALLGATALIGTQFAFLLSGTVIIEYIFAWPGLGWLLVEATQSLDFPVIQTVALVVGVLVFAVNTTADVAIARLDPRISVET